MANLTRRSLLKTSIAGVAAASLSSPLSAEVQPTKRKGRVKQSVGRWCYKKFSLDELCEQSAKIGLQGIDLLQPDEYEIPKRYGLVCALGYAGAGDIPNALNRTENHDAIEKALQLNIPRAAKASVPNVITFSGNRKGMSDEEGLRNTITGLNRVKKIAEDNGVVICLELLNSKVDHHDYMCDHTEWGLRVVQEVNSPNVRLLYDIYHMQIMEGDLIATIKPNIQWIAHFHTGGVPGRHELDKTQEVQWDAVVSAVADTGYKGFIAHEFVPMRVPFTSLREAADLCDV